MSISVPSGTVTGLDHCCHCVGMPAARRTSSATSAPWLSRRVITVRWAAPAHPSSTAIARPAPPAPSIATRLPAIGVTLAMAFTTPLPSLLCPTRRPSSTVTQLAAPMARTSSSTASRWETASILYGTVIP